MNSPAPSAGAVHAGALSVMIASAAPGCQNLAELLDRVPGAYPGEVVAIADQLAGDRLLDPGTRHRLHNRPAAADGETAGAGVPLPAPHPLDYDWRWSARTVRELLAQCLRLTRLADTIALLGTPTILAAAASDCRQRRWVLLEASGATTAALASACPGQVLRCDLASDDLPDLGARAVVADPPWYPADTRSFLWAAARITRPGAAVLLAQPAPATRPGVLAERAAILSFAHQAGLEVTAAHPAALAYSSPPFERAALHAAGLLPLVPDTWRRGDLIVLRRTSTRPGPRPPAPQHGSWHEISLDGARIRFRADAVVPADAPADPRLVPVTSGDILATVSRRDPARDHARVWTGSNRVFGCRAPALLACIARALADGSPVISAVTRHLGRTPTASEEYAAAEATRQLRDLVSAEQRTAAATVAAALPSAARPARDLTARSPL